MGRTAAAQWRGKESTRSEDQRPAEDMALLADALRDLKCIRTQANTAAEEILGACEGLLETLDNGDADACRLAAETAAIEIMTACGFEDLVGQRVNHASAIVKALMAKRLEAVGPAAPSSSDEEDERLSQASVDAFFSEKA